MEQLEFFTVPNPCIGVCSTDEKGYCKGCMRNRDERFHWQKLTSAQQLYVIKLCRQRYRRKQQGAAKPSEPAKPQENPQQTLFPDEGV